MRDIGDSLAADTSEVKNQARERTAVEDGMRAGAVVEVGVHRVTAYSVLEGWCGNTRKQLSRWEGTT